MTNAQIFIVRLCRWHHLQRGKGMQPRVHVRMITQASVAHARRPRAFRAHARAGNKTATPARGTAETRATRRGSRDRDRQTRRVADCAAVGSQDTALTGYTKERIPVTNRRRPLFRVGPDPHLYTTLKYGFTQSHRALFM